MAIPEDMNSRLLKEHCTMMDPLSVAKYSATNNSDTMEQLESMDSILFWLGLSKIFSGHVHLWESLLLTITLTLLSTNIVFGDIVVT